MGSTTPKQYLPLGGRPVALHSFQIFCDHPLVKEIIVVCEKEYRHLFQTTKKNIIFADPGKERQDSVYNGVCALSSHDGFLCTHDSARPFLNKIDIDHLFQVALEGGGAVSAVKTKNTIKQGTLESIIDKTLDRSVLWEIHTPQIVPISKWLAGYKIAIENHLLTTDDAQLAELAGHFVKLVSGSYYNIKITTPEDLLFAQTILTL